MEVAYVLIQCDLGSEVEIIEELSKIEHIKEVRGTYGVYDIFSKLESGNSKFILKGLKVEFNTLNFQILVK